MTEQLTDTHTHTHTHAPDLSNIEKMHTPPPQKKALTEPQVRVGL